MDGRWRPVRQLCFRLRLKKDQTVSDRIKPKNKVHRESYERKSQMNYLALHFLWYLSAQLEQTQIILSVCDPISQLVFTIKFILFTVVSLITTHRINQKHFYNLLKVPKAHWSVLVIFCGSQLIGGNHFQNVSFKQAVVQTSTRVYWSESHFVDLQYFFQKDAFTYYVM